MPVYITEYYAPVGKNEAAYDVLIREIIRGAELSENKQGVEQSTKKRGM